MPTWETRNLPYHWLWHNQSAFAAFGSRREPLREFVGSNMAMGDCVAELQREFVGSNMAMGDCVAELQRWFANIENRGRQEAKNRQQSLLVFSRGATLTGPDEVTYCIRFQTSEA
ncbi:MAG: hypothetical protein ACE361_07925 [Aureliella sp.]